MKRSTKHNPRNANNAAVVLMMMSACLVVLCGGPGLAHAQNRNAPKVVSSRARQESVTPPRLGKNGTRPLREFFTKLKQRVASGELNPRRDFSLTADTTRNKQGRFTAFRLKSFTGDASAQAAAQEFLAALVATQLLTNFAPDAQALTLQLVAGKTELLIKASFQVPNANRAQTLAADYGKFFQTLAAARRTTEDAVFWENTTAQASRDQVIVISNLPRAALNALLAE